MSAKVNFDETKLTLRGGLPGEHTAKDSCANVKVTAKDARHERGITLKEKLAQGGEGAVFETDLTGYVAKIYSREKLTKGRKDKVKYFVDHPLRCEGVCFPEAFILNEKNEFVGYLMRKAQGYELSISVFQPKLLQKRFPQWSKFDTILLCITILGKMKYLNEKGVILGDINPGNILVVSPKEVYFVDCDSYQVGNHPCPVGTPNFTAPEIQRKDYKTFLRTQAMENFAIATLLFMIMLPGKPPYSAVGGETPEKNIRRREFPYPLEDDTDKTPPGKWGFIWSQMSYKTKEAFWNTFHKNGKYFSPEKRLDAEGWLEVFRAYYASLPKMQLNDPMAIEIFPTRIKGDYEVEKRICEACGNLFPITQKVKNWEQRKSEAEGHPVRNTVCPNCKQSPAKRTSTSYTRSTTYATQQTSSTTPAAASTYRKSPVPSRQSYSSKAVGTSGKITEMQPKQTTMKAANAAGSAQAPKGKESLSSKAARPIFIGCCIIVALYSYSVFKSNSGNSDWTWLLVGTLLSTAFWGPALAGLIILILDKVEGIATTRKKRP